MPDATEAKGNDEGSSDLQRKVDRETLRFCVQTAIFCQFTHQPLDVCQAVAVTVRFSGWRHEDLHDHRGPLGRQEGHGPRGDAGGLHAGSPGRQRAVRAIAGT